MEKVLCSLLLVSLHNCPCLRVILQTHQISNGESSLFSPPRITSHCPCLRVILQTHQISNGESSLFSPPRITSHCPCLRVILETHQISNGESSLFSPPRITSHCPCLRVILETLQKQKMFEYFSIHRFEGEKIYILRINFTKRVIYFKEKVVIWMTLANSLKKRVLDTLFKFVLKKPKEGLYIEPIWVFCCFFRQKGTDFMENILESLICNRGNFLTSLNNYVPPVIWNNTTGTCQSSV